MKKDTDSNEVINVNQIQNHVSEPTCCIFKYSEMHFKIV
jgi:hypothetical protein